VTRVTSTAPAPATLVGHRGGRLSGDAQPAPEVEPVMTLPQRPRARELGLAPGIMSTGPRNAITDVAGVRVGHHTLWRGDDVRTGVSVIMPHDGDPFDERVPAGLFVANGFGKLIGATQVMALGELETPIALTNTLSAPEVAAGLIEWTLTRPGHGDVRSVNAFVGETNDGRLNDIRGRHVRPEHVLAAIDAASSEVMEGCVGAGTGTVAFGWKGGIGTSSRRLPDALGGATVGVLVQANHGGVLSMAGLDVGVELGRHYLREALDPGDADGSVMIVVATDAPLSDRNLERLAFRACAALARSGAAFTHGSGDYAVAFSTAEEVRRRDRGRRSVHSGGWPDERLSPLSQAVLEACDEAVLNALCTATTVVGQAGTRVEALPLDAVRVLREARQGGRR